MDRYKVVVDGSGAIIRGVNGMLHGGVLPAIVHPDGGTHWYVHGKRQREDGPAIVSSCRYSYSTWWFNDKIHRDGGPAIEWNDGRTFWFFHGIKMPEYDYWEAYNDKLKKLSMRALNSEQQ